MAVDGVIRVVSGFGSKMEVDGSGIRVAILTRGMDLQDLTRLARLIRRIAGRGLYRVRPTAATIYRHLPITATAVSMVASIYVRWPNVGRMAVNVTTQSPKRRKVVSSGGVGVA